MTPREAGQCVLPLSICDKLHPEYEHESSELLEAVDLVKLLSYCMICCR